MNHVPVVVTTSLVGVPYDSGLILGWTPLSIPLALSSPTGPYPSGPPLSFLRVQGTLGENPIPLPQTHDSVEVQLKSEDAHVPLRGVWTQDFGVEERLWTRVIVDRPPS